MSEDLRKALADRRRAQRVRAGQDSIDVPAALVAFLLDGAGPHARRAAVSALGEETVTALLEYDQTEQAAPAAG